MDKKSAIRFYKAYKLWEQTISSDPKYKQYIQSLNKKTSGDSSLHGFVGNKILDMDWVEKVEEGLPHLDKVIRESRSFIEQRDEVVAVEKVKKITTQSIRHLAQNTYMIAKVEDNGEVLPNKILNIYHESSYEIYENRFLMTLLHKLSDFVENVYNVLKNKDEKIDINYDIDKTVRRKNKLTKINISSEYSAEDSMKFDVKDNPTDLPGFVRVVRIRSILHDFHSSTLIRNLKNVEPVRPPIIRTNLLSKNADFRTCLELFEYLNLYKGKGFSYSNSKFTGKMPKRIENKLFNTFVFTNFINEITFNKSMDMELDKAYRKEIREQKKNNRLLEKQKIENVLNKQEKKTEEQLKKIREALSQKIEYQMHQKNKERKRARGLRKKYNDLKNEYKTLKKLLAPGLERKKIVVPDHVRKDGVEVSGYTYYKTIKKKKPEEKLKSTSKKTESVYKTIRVKGYTRKDGVKVSSYEYKIKKLEKNKKIQPSKNFVKKKIRPKYKFIRVDGYIRPDGRKVSGYTRKVDMQKKSRGDKHSERKKTN